MPSKAQGLITGMKGKLRQDQLARGRSERFCDVTRLGMQQWEELAERGYHGPRTMDHYVTMRCEGPWARYQKPSLKSSF